MRLDDKVMTMICELTEPARKESDKVFKRFDFLANTDARGTTLSLLARLT